VRSRRPEARGVLRTISADGYVAHGLNPSAAIVDEAHAFTTDKQRELFEAGVVFRDDAERLEQRLLGDSGTRNGYQLAENPHR
jgi:hypothetical protein